MISAVACAKINLSLHVRRLRSDGFHPVEGIFQSLTLHDRLDVDVADEDRITGGPIPDGEDNSVMRALRAVRGVAGVGRGVYVRLSKAIPVAAGLGGGSADAAAALAIGGRLFGVPGASLVEMAPELGSDVPFCFRGGTAVVGGRGDRVTPVDFVGGYAVALVVPPVELSTPEVYAAWDRLGEPSGFGVAGPHLPPGLRPYAPLVNDLYPAAVAVAPVVDEWRHELAARWGRPVLLSGSGPSLYAFFVDVAEAEAAAGDVPPGARAATAAAPVPFGWAMRVDEGVVDSSGRRWDERDAPLLAAMGLG